MNAEKTSKPTTTRHQAAGGAFFRKAAEESFFSPGGTSAFFGPGVQPKLNVSQPDDPLEREADAVADQVMRMEDPDSGPVQAAPAQGISLNRRISRQADSSPAFEGQEPGELHRKCDHCEEEENDQNEPYLSFANERP